MRALTVFAILMLTVPVPALGDNCEDRVLSVGGPCLDGTAKSRKGVLPDSSREIYGFRLGKHSFKDVRRIFGETKLWSSGDAAAAEEKVCYVLTEGGRSVTLVFSANAEMSGGTIDGITLIEGPIQFAHECARLSSKASAQLKTKSGIRLGMSLAQLKAILGPPSEVRDGLAFFTYCIDRKAKPNTTDYASCPVASKCSGLTARFETNRLKWVEIGYGDWVC